MQEFIDIKNLQLQEKMKNIIDSEVIETIKQKDPSKESAKKEIAHDMKRLFHSLLNQSDTKSIMLTNRSKKQTNEEFIFDLYLNLEKLVLISYKNDKTTYTYSFATNHISINNKTVGLNKLADILDKLPIINKYFEQGKVKGYEKTNLGAKT